MGLEELSRYIAKEAERIQADLKDTYPRTVGDSSTGFVQTTLIQIEERLAKVEGHMIELLRRFPENFSLELAEFKRSLFERIDSLKPQTAEPTGSTGGRPVVDRVEPLKKNWYEEIFGRLTPREKSIFHACFGSGLITYDELAERLHISPTTVKNKINQLLRDTDKCRLFHKEHIDGVARIKVTNRTENRILHGHKKGSKNDKNPILVLEDRD